MGCVDVLRQIVSTHDERGEETSGWFRMLARRQARRLVSDHCGPILDVGGGDGLLFDPKISPLADVTTILDFDMKVLRDAHRHYGDKGCFVCADLTGIPFPDGMFGTSVCVGTYYNLPTAEMVQKGLCELSRVTRHGGHVLVEFRNAENPFARLAIRYAEVYDKTLKGLPLMPYTYSQIQGMLAKAGLRIIEIKTTGISIKPLIMSYVLKTTHIDAEEG